MSNKYMPDFEQVVNESNLSKEEKMIALLISSKFTEDNNKTVFVPVSEINAALKRTVSVSWLNAMLEHMFFLHYKIPNSEKDCFKKVGYNAEKNVVFAQFAPYC